MASSSGLGSCATQSAATVTFSAEDFKTESKVNFQIRNRAGLYSSKLAGQPSCRTKQFVDMGDMSLLVRLLGAKHGLQTG